MAKKAINSGNFTPLHCACINPNPAILKTLLDINSDLQMACNQMRKPIHYAAACKTPDNLKLLIEKGANVHDIDLSR